jgi:uncharacterized membrane protein required for colicin V production
MILDIIIIILLVLSAFGGWRKGAISIVGSIIILIAAILLASAFGSEFGKAIGAGNSILRPVIGFFLLFLILFIVGQFVKRFLTPKRGVLAGADKFFGVILGVLRAILLLGLVFAFLRIFEIPSTKTANESRTYPLILKSSSLMVSQLKPLAGHLSNDVFESMPSDSLKKK